MKKLLLALMVLIMVSCEKVTVVGTIVDKEYSPAYTEDIPMGYRQDCGLTIHGKYECGFKFFHGKRVYHSAQYSVTFQLEKCEYQDTWPVSEGESNSIEIGEATSVVVYDIELPKECLADE